MFIVRVRGNEAQFIQCIVTNTNSVYLYARVPQVISRSSDGIEIRLAVYVVYEERGSHIVCIGIYAIHILAYQTPSTMHT